MNDTPPATQQFTSAPAVHDVPPEAFAAAASTGIVLYFALGLSAVLMGLVYREVRNLRIAAEALARATATTAAAIASQTPVSGEVTE
jgi:hypothetical protein